MAKGSSAPADGIGRLGGMSSLPTSKRRWSGIKVLSLDICSALPLKLIDNSCRWIQPIDATDSLNISAGVWKPSVLRGLSFNCLAIALS